MDRHLLERLIGAGVLVVALVVVVPAILDGDPGDDIIGDKLDLEADVPDVVTEPRRTHTIRPAQSTERPPVAREVAEPEPDSVKPATVPERKTASSPEPVKPTVSIDTPAVVKAETVAKVQPVVQAKPVAKAEPVVETRPKSPGAPAARGAEPAPVPASGWVVQLGSFSDRSNARRLADDVGGHGFSVFLVPLDRSGKTLYRVRVGPRKTRAQATDLAGRLAKAGYTGHVTQQ